MNMEKIGDLRREEKSSRKTVKGFTLIELIVVIAIIGILAGMTSLVVMGFVNNSRQESANTSAQLVYTSMQNALIQSEIQQNDLPFNAEYVGFDGTPASKNIVYAVVTARVDLGKIMSDRPFEVKTYFDDNSTASVSFTPSTVWDFTKGKRKDSVTDPTKKDYHMAEAFNFFSKYFTMNLGANFTGTCQIYIDYGNYAVDSVVYNEDTNRDVAFLNTWQIKGGSAEKYKIKCMAGTQNIFTQKASHKREGIYFGCYPLLDDIGVKDAANGYVLATNNFDIKGLT